MVRYPIFFVHSCCEQVVWFVLGTVYVFVVIFFLLYIVNAPPPFFLLFERWGGYVHVPHMCISRFACVCVLHWKSEINVWCLLSVALPPPHLSFWDRISNWSARPAGQWTSKIFCLCFPVLGLADRHTPCIQLGSHSKQAHFTHWTLSPALHLNVQVGFHVFFCNFWSDLELLGSPLPAPKCWDNRMCPPGFICIFVLFYLLIDWLQTCKDVLKC